MYRSRASYFRSEYRQGGEVEMVNTPWYARLFYVPLLNFLISWILSLIIQAKRMGFPEMNIFIRIANLVFFVGGCVLLWFIPVRSNVAFWIGLVIIVVGQVIFGFGYSAMREHPEQKKTVVDWGIYRFSRHSHIIAGIIVLLGTIIMGWDRRSFVYLVVWIYCILNVVFTHYAIKYEEKRNVEKFGQEYQDYMKRVPRYFLFK